MSKTALDATAGSSANRNVSRDRAAIDLVRGEIALAERRPDEAEKLFDAARLVESRNADMLESRAAAAVAGGHLEDAAKRYDELIARRSLGNEGQEQWLRAHVQLGAVYERLGRADAARQTYDRLVAMWKDGDADLTALKEARARLEKLNTGIRN